MQTLRERERILAKTDEREQIKITPEAKRGLRDFLMHDMEATGIGLLRIHPPVDPAVARDRGRREPKTTTPVCTYCEEPARWRIEPDASDELIYACDDHEERAIVENGNGSIQELPPALRVVPGGKTEA